MPSGRSMNSTDDAILSVRQIRRGRVSLARPDGTCYASHHMRIYRTSDEGSMGDSCGGPCEPDLSEGSRAGADRLWRGLDDLGDPDVN